MRDNMQSNSEEPRQEITPGQAQLDSSITQKINYLETLQRALHDRDDRQIYELIDKTRYDREVKKNHAQQLKRKSWQIWSPMIISN